MFQVGDIGVRAPHRAIGAKGSESDAATDQDPVEAMSTSGRPVMEVLVRSDIDVGYNSVSSLFIFTIIHHPLQ